MRITRRVEFSASHSCHNAALSDEENHALYGADANPHGHGHNYALEVTLEGEPDRVTGMVVDLKDVKCILEEEILTPMDHRHLNFEVSPFDTVVPTPENLVVEMWRRLAPRFAEGPASLCTIRLFETADLYVDYEGR